MYNGLGEFMIKRVYSFIIATVLLSTGWMSVSAQGSESKYFSETGHNVYGEFLVYYESNPDATFIFGYPITEQFTGKDGSTVQYFQRARFELQAEMPEGQRVQLSALGQDTFSSTSSLKISNPFACRTYAETGHSVCFAFREFFDQYGGLTQFGYPISDFEYHENKIVQYFQNARLEWQPWKLEGQRVVVSDLGRIYFDQLSEDPALLAPVDPINNAPKVTTSLQVQAFVLKAVTLATDTESIFVVVQDQNGQPVSNANCAATMDWPNHESSTTAIVTNTNGVGIFSFSFSNQPYGNLVYADVTCTYNGLSTTTTTSFRVWY